jgi:hypothetical protein
VIQWLPSPANRSMYRPKNGHGKMNPAVRSNLRVIEASSWQHLGDESLSGGGRRAITGKHVRHRSSKDACRRSRVPLNSDLIITWDDHHSHLDLLKAVSHCRVRACMASVNVRSPYFDHPALLSCILSIQLQHMASWACKLRGNMFHVLPSHRCHEAQKQSSET